MIAAYKGNPFELYSVDSYSVSFTTVTSIHPELQLEADVLSLSHS